MKQLPSSPLLLHGSSCNFPDYTIRESRKAKYLRLKVSVDKGVEVIVPMGFDPKRIPELLYQKQAWLAKATQTIEEKRQFFAEQSGDFLPTSLSLTAINEHWEIKYQSQSYLPSQEINLIETAENQLILQGNIDNPDQCKKLLRNWLAKKAQEHLLPWLDTVSEFSQLSFSKTAIRGQKTRWASCSSYKTISINYKLLFLPAPVVHYVFIHELCHTVHMNHSPVFWKLVSEKEPNYKELDRYLRNAWRNVPAWVEQ